MRNELRAGLVRLRRDLAGSTAIEYAMIVLFVALLLIASMVSIGSTVSSFFLEAATPL